MKYLLILVLANQTFVNSIEFDSKETCEAAKKELLGENPQRRYLLQYEPMKGFCLPK